MFYAISQRIGSIKILKKLNKIFSRKEVRKNKGIDKLKKIHDKRNITLKTKNLSLRKYISSPSNAITQDTNSSKICLVRQF